MRNAFIIACALAVLLPAAAAAQSEQGSGSASGAGAGQAGAAAQKNETPRPQAALRTRANIKIDVTISDQTGNGPVEKKVVSVIAAEESWGKIRTQAVARAQDGAMHPVALNVDARPWLTGSGAIQLELTVAYNPLAATAKDTAQMRPTELNQSMTIVLQSGKPMIVSQAADPIMDRKIVVEVVAAVLK
jgi:hypothetical protein